MCPSIVQRFHDVLSFLILDELCVCVRIYVEVIILPKYYPHFIKIICIVFLKSASLELWIWQMIQRAWFILCLFGFPFCELFSLEKNTSG